MTTTTLAEAKAHMGVTLGDDDALITAKIAAAEAWAASYIGTALDDAEAFPDGTPEPLKEAVRRLTAELYENREASAMGLAAQALPFGILDLLKPYRGEWF